MDMPGIFDDERRGDWRTWARPEGLAQTSPAKASKMLECGRTLPCALLLFSDDFASNAASQADPKQTLNR